MRGPVVEQRMLVARFHPPLCRLYEACFMLGSNWRRTGRGSSDHSPGPPRWTTQRHLSVQPPCQLKKKDNLLVFNNYIRSERRGGGLDEVPPITRPVPLAGLPNVISQCSRHANSKRKITCLFSIIISSLPLSTFLTPVNALVTVSTW